MAGGLVRYRHLSRDSAHRQALLRNLVTSLIKHESIHTTYAKAKEAQRVAEKLITLAKRNNETSRRAAQSMLFTPFDLLPKLFGELRRRYEVRPGGYTRVLRTEPISGYDQGESAVLQLVDGPRDVRFAMTAAAVARDRRLQRPSTPLTLLNRKKTIKFRRRGAEAFDQMVQAMAGLNLSGRNRGDTITERLRRGDASGGPRRSGGGGADVSGSERPQTRTSRPPGARFTVLPPDAAAGRKGVTPEV
ncbi:50S ribosomal protein L17 [Xylariomycetidae sp. FL0641]|nr:50S ribosomal protein L17 [Xylariomycetidae sp. FL0641]